MDKIVVHNYDRNYIRKIQKRLNELGFDPLVVDGIYGPKTRQAIIDFQKFHFQQNPNVIVNGEINTITYNLLFPEELEREAKSNISSLYTSGIDLDNDQTIDFTQDGIKLILDFEVGGGKEYYNKFLSRPTWPGYNSGVTIGIGYDLGYNSKENFDNDFSKLDSNIRKRLYSAIGVTGKEAKSLVEKLRDIYIPWEIAYDVFINKTLPKWYSLTKRTFPGIENFHPNVKAALTSIVFNRGPLIDNSDRRLEMKKIRDIHIPNRDYQGIAREIRNMKRHWVGTDIEAGMRRRREAEASLIESIIKNQKT